ncbi:MAG: helix-turn-helix domain-containing protein [Woeseiaceae bacterium]
MHAAKFVESYFDAWNHNDPEGVADHLASDGIYVDMPENVRRTHDELVISLNDFFSEFPHRYEVIGDILTGRNSIAFQYRVCPTRALGTGVDSSPYCGAEFMTLDGDAAVRIADYYDFPTAAETGKYAKSGLRRRQMRKYKKRLEQIMASEHAYLRSSLTLPSLAKAVGCSVNHLSQVINAGFGMSFFDYINSHRIKHARTLLSELEGSNGAVLNVAFSAGFNSNSAFYAAFKKHVGMTPAQFRSANAESSPA